MTFEATAACAQQLDAQDPLRHFRERFHLPQHEGQPAIYCCGNSLGLQPKSAADAVMQELEDWKNLGVEGHFQGQNPWFHYHKFLNEPAARVVGALPHEVVVMNSLTVNLHLMMVSFYRPTPTRFKIMVEADAFPSDHYAVASQARFHGFDPAEAVIELRARPGEYTLRRADILQAIEEAGDSLALVMLGGVNYYTGQAFPLRDIAEAAHRVGALAGFDLAHAAGNLPLQLHDSGADFAVWCTYKYLNSGPGGTSGVFVHERHAQNAELPRFAGWWGHSEEVRFLMEKTFVPMPGAAGWQLSNAQILPMAVHLASLRIFDEAGMPALAAKSRLLTGYLEFLIQALNIEKGRTAIQIITPRNPDERGCQLSLVMDRDGKRIHGFLAERGVIADWREPNVIRVAPVPLYNTFAEMFALYELLQQAVE